MLLFCRSSPSNLSYILESERVIEKRFNKHIAVNGDLFFWEWSPRVLRELDHASCTESTEACVMNAAWLGVASLVV